MVQNPKIGVAIVTYNRLSYLQICLCKVKSQTYQNFEIVVINNNSNDGTREFLLSTDVEQIHLSENTGPAGGFHEAIKYLTKRGEYDFLWLMDDDVFAAKDCLEELLNNVENNRLMYPMIRNKDYKTLAYPGWSGLLMPFSIAKRAGLPKKELFFWAEDTEYLQNRIGQKLGCKIKWVTKAKVVHFTTSVKQRKPWEYYYEVRNMTYYRLHVQEGRIFSRTRKITKTCIKLFLLSVLSKDPRNTLFFCKGFVDGVFGKLGRTVEPR